MDRLSHYELVEQLGAGGMGVVYRARDLRLGRFVAVKVLAPGMATDPERRQRFAQEARAASALNHPNVLTVHEVGSEGDVDFIVTEYVPGETLASLVPPGGLRPRDALRLAVQVADALVAAHAAGIVHRDLKPANVMVTEAGLVKVLDFGLAKLLDPGAALDGEETAPLLTREGQVLGTCAYMSPEQAEGRPVDARSDVFAFGAVLYEMVTGRKAFARDSPSATIAAVLRDDPEPAGQVSRNVPPGLEKLLGRCLRKDPARRFQSMADLKVALEELVEELGTGSSRAAVRRAPSRPGAALALGAVSLAACVGAGVWLGRRMAPAIRTGSAPVPLTSFSGITVTPAISPDGRMVAFAWNGPKEDNLDIYVKQIGPGTPLRLTTDPAPDQAPAWSPDGSQIAFVRVLGGGRAAVVVVPAIGGPERRVAEGDFAGRPVFTRDGSSLIVPAGEPPDRAVGLFLLSIGKGTTRRLTRPGLAGLSGDGDPALSPDGRTLAFRRGVSALNSELHLLALTPDLDPDGEPRALTHEGTYCSRPAFAPDGRSIVFSAGTVPFVTPELRVIPLSARGEKARRLESGAGGDSPTVSPQGRLVYVRWQRDTNVWRLRLGAGDPPERLIASTRVDNNPELSPDGTKVVFTSDRSGSHQLWLANADGSDPRPLTSMGGTMTSGGRWSPDGRWILVISNEEGQMEIYRTTPEGRTPERLTFHEAHDTGPSWSADGRSIYFASNRSGKMQTWRMPAAGGPAVQVTRDGGYSAKETPDGRTLVYSRPGDGGFSLWSVPVAGGEERQMWPRLATSGDFDTCSGGIAFIDGTGPAHRLLLRAPGSTSETLLWTLQKPSSFGLDVRPDLGVTLFTQVDQVATELMLVEGFR